MAARYVTLWFPHLVTDWLALKRPEWQQQPFVLATPVHGRMMITAVNIHARALDITTGMAVADARALYPALQVVQDKPELPQQLLQALGEWCIRFTPVTAVDLPDGLTLDASGCTHLWGGEQAYLHDILNRLRRHGYHVHASVADTPAAAWAVTRYQPALQLIPPGSQAAALAVLPPEALRLPAAVCERLRKLGLKKAGSFMNMPRNALRRRFGPELLLQLDQALGLTATFLTPLQPIPEWEERLPCLEPIVTAEGIEIAIDKLLQPLCLRLQQTATGLRKAVLTCYRTDGQQLQATIGTNRPVHQPSHLFALLQQQIASLQPGPGIELFVLNAPETGPVTPAQETLWSRPDGLEAGNLALLLDRLAGRIGADAIRRYLPAEHHWPEKSLQKAASLTEQPALAWPQHQSRPLQLLPRPEPVTVTAPVPDYPPMLFRYKGALHKIIRADGPERIEREWWLDAGEHRDYYYVEDENGQRYWLFRNGHYNSARPQHWFIHGFFA